MPPYADFQADDSYVSKYSGSAVEAVLLDENDPSESVVGAVTSIQYTDDFETIPIEEAGQDGVDEIVQGRHAGTGTIQAFFTPEWNDNLPTRQFFIGRKFTILERIGANRPNEGTVLNAFTGCALSRNAASHGARGAKTLDLAFSYERRYNGEEWAALTGT